MLPNSYYTGRCHCLKVKTYWTLLGSMRILAVEVFGRCEGPLRNKLKTRLS